MAESYCIRVEDFLIDDVWERCIPFLENPEIGEIEFTSLDSVKAEVIEGNYQLWILMQDDALSGCFLTNISEVANGIKIVNIFYLSGQGVKIWIQELDDKIVEFCKENGCKFYSCTARRGFSKLVPKLEEAGTLYVRKI